MSEIVTALAELLPEGRVTAGDATSPEEREDVCRAPLGTPRAWVRPRSTAEVVRVIDFARARRVPVVAAGLRTAYWRPLRFADALVLDTRSLTTLDAPELDARTIWCDAGVSVREVDDALRARGLTLPAHPDAYGDTPIAAMVATGFTSGVGMGTHDANALVAGLELVLGTGAVVRTGASTSLSASPFLRTGLPDPTGLLLASEGALGVITRVAVRARRRAHRCRLATTLPPAREGLERALQLARSLRVEGLYETFRAIDPGDPARAQPVELDVIVRSPISRAELVSRVQGVTALLTRASGARVHQQFEAPDQATIPRFWGAAGEAWTRTRAGRLSAVDINLSYRATPRALEISDALRAEAAAAPCLNLRRALYFAPGYVNLGLHFSLDAAATSDADARALIERGASALAELPILPYRFGRVWGAALGPRLDPGYRALMLALKRSVDPANILNPGVSIFGLDA